MGNKGAIVHVDAHGVPQITQYTSVDFETETEEAVEILSEARKSKDVHLGDDTPTGTNNNTIIAASTSASSSTADANINSVKQNAKLAKSNAHIVTPTPPK